MKKSIFLFFAAILCTTSAWGADVAKNTIIYFDNSVSQWNYQFHYFTINDDYGWKMTKVDNTLLYVHKRTANTWGGYSKVRLFATTGDWGDDKNLCGGENNMKQYGANLTKTVTNYGFSADQYYTLKPDKKGSSSSQANLTAGWIGSSLSAMNKTITVKAKVSTDKGATYAEETSPGTLTASSFKFTAYNSCKSATSLSSGKITCGYTANTTLTAQTDVEGYVFAGWYDDNGTRKTADATLTINPTADATYFAYYTAEPKHNVEITWVCGATELQASQTVPVGEGTPYSVEAPKFKDYTFSGWTLGSGVQSVDETANSISIKTKSSGEYTLTANYTYIEPVIKTIYCKMEHNWWYSDGAAISAYVWGDEEGEWKSAPGALMALAPWETKVWKIDIDIARYPKVCFIRVKGDGSANWGAQTKDLVIPTDEKNLFTISNTDATWASSSKCDGAWSVYTPAPVPDRYLTGNAAGFGMTIDGEGNEKWSPNTIKMTWNDATQKFTHTVSGLEANKYYKFRITDGDWNDNKWGYSNLNPKVDNVFEAEDNNISFVLSAAGDLTIAFDGTNIELTPTSSFAAPVYTIVGDELLMGTHWGLSSVENQMKHSSGNLYTLEKTVRIPAGEYEYKAVRNYSYDWEVPNNGGKKKITIDKSGEGTIIYTLDIANYELKHEIKNWEEKDLSNTVELYGIGENKTFIEVDRNTTSVNVELEANKVYSFEVIVNSVYMQNEGVMWRGNCEGWTFTPEGSRAHIITDLAGTYTFTWTYGASEQLTVTYPDDGTNVPAPVFLAGKMNNWERLATRLIPNADGKTASAKVELERNVYNDFRMVIGTEDWTNTGTMDRGNCTTGWTFDKVTVDNKDVNAGIIPDVTGEYTFTWSYTDNTLSVTYPKQTCTECSNWYLCGDFNSWKLTDEFMQVEPKVVRAIVALEAGEEYKFKVQDMTNPRDGKWWGNKGKMQRGGTSVETEGWTFEQKSGEEYNCTIVADLAGDYIFTWNTDTKKLTVTYPEIIIGDGDNSNVLNSLNGKTVDLTVTRSFASGTLYTLVLPFAMDNNTVINVFGANVELYDFTSLSENNGELILSFTKQATPVIVAGTPYLIKPATNANGFDLTGVTINTDTTHIEKTYGTTTITMQPVLSATAEAKTNGTSQYWLAADNNLYNNVVSIKGLRVIFDVQTTKANVRARAAFNENIETGLDNNQLPISNIQKLIENGQLIIIREGVKYNVQGQKL